MYNRNKITFKEKSFILNYFPPSFQKCKLIRIFDKETNVISLINLKITFGSVHQLFENY